jgi:hypothetical protein
VLVGAKSSFVPDVKVISVLKKFARILVVKLALILTQTVYLLH